ncbi:uncharacterized protein [Emydura macquarii macquarii]|uniref:uncharacterized protein n=1 Tax=Emydura macquarii macquarii TaxID=1129001 RepID=UPI00352A9310
MGTKMHLQALKSIVSHQAAQSPASGGESGPAPCREVCGFASLLRPALSRDSSLPPHSNQWPTLWQAHTGFVRSAGGAHSRVITQPGPALPGGERPEQGRGQPGAVPRRAARGVSLSGRERSDPARCGDRSQTLHRTPRAKVSSVHEIKKKTAAAARLPRREPGPAAAAEPGVRLRNSGQLLPSRSGGSSPPPARASRRPPGGCACSPGEQAAAAAATTTASSRLQNEPLPGAREGGADLPQAAADGRAGRRRPLRPASRRRQPLGPVLLRLRRRDRARPGAEAAGEAAPRAPAFLPFPAAPGAGAGRPGAEPGGLRPGLRRLPLLPGRAVGRLRAQPDAAGEAHVLAEAAPPVRGAGGRGRRAAAGAPGVEPRLRAGRAAPAQPGRQQQQQQPPPAEEEEEPLGAGGGGGSEFSSLSEPERPLHAPGRDQRARSPAGCPGPSRSRPWRPGQPPAAPEEAPGPQDNGLAGEETTRRRRRRRRRPWPAGARSGWRGGQGAAGPADGCRAAPAPRPGEGDLRGERAPAYDSSEESEINITSDEEGPGAGRAPSRLEGPSRPPWAAAAPAPPGTVCYICGSPLARAGQHPIHVQKQERSSSKAPFFPFLWLHSPPPGARPISPGGSTLACSCCFASLMQQWQSFELASVPVLQRLYVVPLDAGPLGMPPKARRAQREEGSPALPQEACYLCGEDCGKEARPVSAKITNGNAKSTMHFPFLSRLPCPPGALGLNKHWEVHSCRKCYGVLQDLWAMYRACHNEELITSVQSFLGRYHQVFSTGEASSMALNPSAPSGHASVCYICGAELGAGKEFQLNVNPPGRFGEKEPFFPFLTVYPPAPRARPADSTGLVATCVLCYHDLLSQWLQHEGRNSHHPSSAWSRQYKVETFVCFFCRQEKKRCLGLKAVQVARLPVFLYTLRVANSLLVDDGKQLTIGACAECGAVVLAGKTMTPPASLPKRGANHCGASGSVWQRIARISATGGSEAQHCLFEDQRQRGLGLCPPVQIGGQPVPNLPLAATFGSRRCKGTTPVQGEGNPAPASRVCIACWGGPGSCPGLTPAALVTMEIAILLCSDMAALM